MSRAFHHNRLQVHYRVLQQGETATVWLSGATASDTVPERWPAWLVSGASIQASRAVRRRTPCRTGRVSISPMETTVAGAA